MDYFFLTVVQDGKEIRRKAKSWTLHNVVSKWKVKKWKDLTKTDKRKGLSTIWHINGEKWKEQKHKLGKPVGIWKT